MADGFKCFSKIFHDAVNKAADCEIWPGYYQRRYNEFLKYYKVFPNRSFNSILEIGCGIGYQSALLGCIGDVVVASDVDKKDNAKHSRGLDITNEFISRLQLKNIDVYEASAEQLPFYDQQFDFIFCSYTFQYVSNKKKALAEIRRVLKPGGYFFCIVPTVSDRLEALAAYYWSFFKRRLLLKRPVKSALALSNSLDKFEVKKRSFFNKLLPPPDDGSGTFFSELYQRRKENWENIFNDQSFSVERAQYTASLKDQNNSYFGFKRIFAPLRSSGIIYLLKKYEN